MTTAERQSLLQAVSSGDYTPRMMSNNIGNPPSKSPQVLRLTAAFWRNAWTTWPIYFKATAKSEAHQRREAQMEKLHTFERYMAGECISDICKDTGVRSPYLVEYLARQGYPVARCPCCGIILTNTDVDQIGMWDIDTLLCGDCFYRLGLDADWVYEHASYSHTRFSNFVMPQQTVWKICDMKRANGNIKNISKTVQMPRTAVKDILAGNM